MLKVRNYFLPTPILPKAKAEYVNYCAYLFKMLILDK